jgi:hypothetical protein
MFAISSFSTLEKNSLAIQSAFPGYEPPAAPWATSTKNVKKLPGEKG